MITHPHDTNLEIEIADADTNDERHKKALSAPLLTDLTPSTPTPTTNPTLFDLPQILWFSLGALWENLRQLCRRSRDLIAVVTHGISNQQHIHRVMDEVDAGLAETTRDVAEERERLGGLKDQVVDLQARVDQIRLRRRRYEERMKKPDAGEDGTTKTSTTTGDPSESRGDRTKGSKVD